MYSGSMTGSDWRSILQNKTQGLVSITDEGYDIYKKWYDFSYGKTMAELATALGITEDEATAMNLAFNAVKEFYDCMNNVAVGTDDRKTKLIKFY